VPAGAAGAVLAAVGEACANAIEHAYGMDPTRRIEVRLSLRHGRVEAIVRDTGPWVEPVAGRSSGVRGRGRMMMDALMDEAVVDGGPNGTTVRLVKEIHYDR
jgi:anti-sigma regulatory factor (Ser/Thr protein kinase)